MVYSHKTHEKQADICFTKHRAAAGRPHCSHRDQLGRLPCRSGRPAHRHPRLHEDQGP
ncbi:hypothetical protein ACFFKE_30110 [Streptomyces mutabilis]|uniref:hypothetical protein n=1 Tax=Streptomyces mutabilis TaxID=67332 RepID=UPI0034D7B64C